MSSLTGLLRLCNERLTANRRLLAVLDPATPEHAAHVDRQKAVFGTALQAMPTMPEHLAVDLCEAVAGVGWPDYTEQIQAIMDHIVPPAENRLLGQLSTSRTQLQNYVDMEHHVPARIWQMNAREDFAPGLCEWLSADMGCQNASESTVQKAVALSLLIIHNGRRGAVQASWSDKRSLTELVKRCMKQHRHQRPAEWVETLPRDQRSFHEQYPLQWAQSQARGDNRAVPCPHHAGDVQAVLVTVPMRNSMKRLAERNLGSGAPLGNSYPGSGAPLGNSLVENPLGQAHDFMRMFAQILGGRGFRGPGDGGGDIALEFTPPRQQLQVVMIWLMGLYLLLRCCGA